MATNERHRVAIIGAGVSGLVAIRELVAAGLDVQAFEQSDDVVGVWSGVYDSVHLLTSRTATAFRGYPMPEKYAQFPSADDYREYIRAFAKDKCLLQWIRFETQILSASPVEGGSSGWELTLPDGSTEHFDALVAANGHLSKPNIPQYRGTFEGKTIHTSQYRNPSDIEGQAVLVVGSGNSACDMVMDAINSGRHPLMSLRRPTWFVPQSLFGTPRGDFVLFEGGSVGAEDHMTRALVEAAVGNPSAYGFPEPEEDDWSTQPPTFSTLIPYWAQRGRVRAVPEIAQFDGGRTVRFVDDTVRQFDTIIWATGYQAAVPFIDESLITRIAGRPARKVGGLLSADLDNFYFSGLASPRGGAPHNYGRGAETLARLVTARFLLDAPLTTTVFDDETASGRMDWLLKDWVTELERADQAIEDAIARSTPESRTSSKRSAIPATTSATPVTRTFRREIGFRRGGGGH